MDQVAYVKRTPSYRGDCLGASAGHIVLYVHVVMWKQGVMRQKATI